MVVAKASFSGSEIRSTTNMFTKWRGDRSKIQKGNIEYRVCIDDVEFHKIYLPRLTIEIRLSDINQICVETDRSSCILRIQSSSPERSEDNLKNLEFFQSHCHQQTIFLPHVLPMRDSHPKVVSN